MTLAYHPRAGQILICKFDGFRVPEMVKVRPVMVFSPRLPHRSENPQATGDDLKAVRLGVL